jgi:hypothetical protein
MTRLLNDLLFLFFHGEEVEKYVRSLFLYEKLKINLIL